MLSDTKETYKRDLQKRPTKNMQKRPTKDTCKRILQKRPAEDVYNNDQDQMVENEGDSIMLSDAKETYKRDFKKRLPKEIF